MKARNYCYVILITWNKICVQYVSINLKHLGRLLQPQGMSNREQNGQNCVLCERRPLLGESEAIALTDAATKMLPTGIRRRNYPIDEQKYSAKVLLGAFVKIDALP